MKEFIIALMVGMIIGWFANKFWEFNQQMSAYFGKLWLWEWVKEKYKKRI